MYIATLLCACLLLGTSKAYLVGVGMADMTGPAADVNMMGYALPQQTTDGIAFRLRSRAFVIGSDKAAANEKEKRFVFVSIDVGMGSISLTEEVVKRLDAKYPGVYTFENVGISGTHTHSGAAGFLFTTLFQIPSLGFVHEAFDAFVTGIVQSIINAHENAKPGRKISLAVGAMEKGIANINRSPSAYLLNPQKERDFYGHNTDLNMTLLRFEEPDGTPIGMLNWFAVHGTSVPNTNHLINGDNKGYASQLFEFWQNGPSVKTGDTNGFVSAFASTNLGDVSPNINGTFCSDTGKPCEELHSTCDGKNENCHGRGPSSDPFKSAAIIGTRQAELAKKLFEKPSSKRRFRMKDDLAGETDVAMVRADINGDDVDFVHVFRDFSKIQVKLDNNEIVQTCKPAMGYSFAAGTTDGPGMFDFYQGENRTNPFWEFVRDFIATPSDEIKECQDAKPVLFPTGEMNEPYPWDPSILPLQIMRIGNQIAILSVPAEFTTMAGRRLRNAVRKVLVEKGVLDGETGQVVIAGLANEYASYCTTFEEYQQQRYEAGSTLYGPHTHQAYIQEFEGLAHAMSDSRKPEPGPKPEALLDRQISLLPWPLPDSVPWGKKFGQVAADVESEYTCGPDLVISAKFHTGNPRNNMRLEGTYLEIQKLDGEKWSVVATDSDFDTRYIYERKGVTQSFAVIEWRPADALRVPTSGTYRIVHYGDRKHITGKIQSFQGHSKPFKLSVPRTWKSSESLEVDENQLSL